MQWHFFFICRSFALCRTVLLPLFVSVGWLCVRERARSQAYQKCKSLKLSCILKLNIIHNKNAFSMWNKKSAFCFPSKNLWICNGNANVLEHWLVLNLFRFKRGVYELLGQRLMIWCVHFIGSGLCACSAPRYVWKRIQNQIKADLRGAVWNATINWFKSAVRGFCWRFSIQSLPAHTIYSFPLPISLLSFVHARIQMIKNHLAGLIGGNPTWHNDRKNKRHNGISSDSLSSWRTIINIKASSK